MFDRFERPIKIFCLAMAAVLVCQVAGLILRGDPLAHVKIPPLPSLPETTNEPVKIAPKATNVTNATNAANVTNVVHGTNAMANSTNVVHGTNTMANSTNASKAGKTRPMNGMPPEMMAAMMMRGGMPGGPGGSPMKKIELPPEVQARVDRIIDSEILGPVMRPMPMALIGIADQEAYIQATNGQTGPVKIGGEMGGVKLLCIGINRVLVEQNGEKKELTIFGGKGGESLMPKTDDKSSTNTATNSTLSRKLKETK
jgi:hypothetical protein